MIILQHPEINKITPVFPNKLYLGLTYPLDVNGFYFTDLRSSVGECFVSCPSEFEAKGGEIKYANRIQPDLIKIHFDTGKKLGYYSLIVSNQMGGDIVNEAFEVCKNKKSLASLPKDYLKELSKLNKLNEKGSRIDLIKNLINFAENK